MSVDCSTTRSAPRPAILRARWSSCTAAARRARPPRRCSTCSIPERRLVGIAPGGPLSLPPGGRHWYSIARARLSAAPTASCRPTSGSPLVRRPAGRVRRAGGTDHRRRLLPRRRDVLRVALGAGPPRARGHPRDELLHAHRRRARARPDQPPGPTRWRSPTGRSTRSSRVEFGRQARDRVLEAGADVLYRESPVAHTRSTPAGAADWLRRSGSLDQRSTGHLRRLLHPQQLRGS